MTPVDFLERILERKRAEIARRLAHADLLRRLRTPGLGPDDGCERRVSDDPTAERRPWSGSRAELACAALRRPAGEQPRVVAEIKMRSPSAGTIRQRRPGAVSTIARAYAQAGASALSVLCDGPGFGGTPLDVRRASASASLPVLFKEFVLDEIQIRLARDMGAHMVLLLARPLSFHRLNELVLETIRYGLAPLVEVWNEAELASALSTQAAIVGVNARDLKTFRIDSKAARRLVRAIPGERITVYMSGLSSREDLCRVADTRADAVLIGEALMRAPSPGARLSEILVP